MRRRFSALLLICLILALLCGCGAKAVPLNQRVITTADLFHEDGLYPFLSVDSSDEQFTAALGATKDAINEATTDRWMRLQEADPAFVFTFEGVPAMVNYSNGFSISLDFQNTDLETMKRATAAILDTLEAQAGTRSTLSSVDRSFKWNDMTIMPGVPQLEDSDEKIISSLGVSYPKPKL